MKNEGEQHAQGVKSSLEGIMGADLSLKRKRKTERDINREVFEKIILALEKASVRSSIIGGDFQLDFTEYDEVSTGVRLSGCECQLQTTIESSSNSNNDNFI